MSAAELAREWNVSQALASYHLRKLIEANLVEFVSERSNRGALERFYRASEAATSRSLSDNSQTPLIIRAIVAEMERRVSKQDESQRAYVADAELWVTPDVMQTAQDEVEAAVSRLIKSATLSTTAGAIKVSVSAALFAITTASPDVPKRAKGAPSKSSSNE